MNEYYHTNTNAFRLADLWGRKMESFSFSPRKDSRSNLTEKIALSFTVSSSLWLLLLNGTALITMMLSWIRSGLSVATLAAVICSVHSIERNEVRPKRFIEAKCLLSMRMTRYLTLVSSLFILYSDFLPSSSY